jgi:HEAT repeat protein
MAPVLMDRATGLWASALPRQRASQPEREAAVAFQKGQFEEVAGMLESWPSGKDVPPEVFKLGTQSYVRLGRVEAALNVYARLLPPGRQDDPKLLQEIGLALLKTGARDSQEHVRIATYTAFKDLAEPDLIPVLEDGLFDTSVVVRALAAEGLARALSRTTPGSPKNVSGLKRAVDDRALAVRIAGINGLGDVGDRSSVELLRGIARADEGPASMFALASLVKLGHPSALDEILSGATLPDPNVRIAALGVLGRLKHHRSFQLLSQAVYDPDPAVRAFAAGALGEYGTPDAAAPLTHAIGDEDPRVRSIAASSLGRLNLPHTKPLLWQAAKDPIDLVRIGAVEALLRLGDSDAMLVARELATHPNPSVRGAVAQAIGQAHNKAGLPLLDRLRQDQQPQPRLMAARALGKLHTRDAVPSIRHAMQDSDAAVRLTAAGSLLQALHPPK